MKRILLLSLAMFIACRLPAQHKVIVDSIPLYVPHYYISTDVVYDVESIPMVGFEKFFVTNKRLKSWKVDIAYQVHYNNQFGIATSHGDRISVGVYQGPAARLGYNIYSHRHKHRWMHYGSPSLGLKYLSYDLIQVNTGKRLLADLSSRIQSEKCIDAVPQFAIGAKRVYKDFCADFYVGLQFPIKDRMKTIYGQYNSQGVPFGSVPYNSTVTTFFPAPMFGIKLGYIK
jgi:hypothetical protein